MKKKISFAIFILIWIGVSCLVAANQYASNIYELNLVEYLRYSSALTDRERNYLEHKGVINFVSDENAPPFSFIDPANNQYKGLLLDYANALSLDLGLEISFDLKEWGRAVDDIADGDADICDMFASNERKKELLFSDAIYRMHGIAVTKKGGEKISSSADLQGKRVGMASGDYAEEFVKEQANHAVVVETPDISHAMKALMEEEVDVVIGDEAVILYFVGQSQLRDAVDIMKPTLYEKDVAFAVKKADAQLLRILNKGILHMKRQQVMQSIQQKWFGLSQPIEKSKIPSNLLMGVMMVVNALLIVFVISLIHNKSLKREVRNQTKELIKSRHDLQVTLDALYAYLITLSEDGVITNANKSFCDWFGSGLDQIIGKFRSDIPFIEAIYEQYGLISCGQAQSQMSRQEERSQVFLYNESYFRISIIQLANHGRILIVADDITDQMINHQQLLQHNKMIAVGQLAAGVAHEIRNPLGNIRNYCYILKTRIAIDEPVIGNCINVIETSVNRAGEIVDNLLNFSRMGNDELQVVSIRSLLENVIRLFASELAMSHIEVEVDCRSEFLVAIKVESMNHIILNLLSNARDAMIGGGKINIRCNVKGDVLYLNFEDSGVGIPDNVMPHIFNPFFTTKKVGSGTGLGLYIVYSELNKLGGKLQVESRNGEGTKFSFEIPVETRRQS